MADWQVEFAIVPKRALVKKPPVPIPNLIDADWWASEHLPQGYARQLGAIASVGSSGTAELQTWGREDENRIDVWFEHGKPVRMVARVDVRRLDAKFGALLLQFARTAGAVLVRRDGLVVEPAVGAFGAALRSSTAWQYASDPAASFGAYSDATADDDE